MFFKSPFTERLAQINANFKIPADSKYSREFHDLLKSMLQRNPDDRLGASEIWSILDLVREKIVKEQYTTAKPLIEQRGMAKSATTAYIGQMRDPQSIQMPKQAPPKPPTVPMMAAPQEAKPVDENSIHQLTLRLIQANENPIKERDTRILITTLHKQRDQENAFYRHLAV